MLQIVAVCFVVFVFTQGSVVKMKISQDSKEDLGEPLYLTPLLKEEQYLKAQELARVRPDLGNVTSYSGYLTVHETCESHLFFWFFPAQRDDWEHAPLLLWLQGGPGSSSLFGLFEELGPFQVTNKGIKKRKYSWNNLNNVLFLDQPVGTGFSFGKRQCYAKNLTAVGEALYQAVVQFYQLFPPLSQNRLIIAGESYAGHYIPSLGHFIHKNNPTASITVNLSAIMIGNGLMDATYQSDYSDFLYQLGLIDDTGKEEFKRIHSRFTNETDSNNWADATETLQQIGRHLKTYVGRRVNKYNILTHSDKNAYWKEFVSSPEVRRQIHVNRITFKDSSHEVYYSLANDIPQSEKPWIEELLQFYPLVFFFGQLDIVCAYPLAVSFLRSLSWDGHYKYLNASRSKWCVGEEQAGYFKGEHHLYDVLVRGAGHMVPMDQPHWAYELVNSVTSGTPDNPLHALTTCN